MKWFLICLSFGLTQLALGNAKVVKPHANAMMTTERVDVSIRGDAALVHGSFKFQVVYTRDTNAPDGKVYFPLAVAKGAQPAMEDFEFNLKVNGQKARSYSLVAKPPVVLSDSEDYSVIWIAADFPGTLIRRRAHVQVVYEQKLLEGVFYYLPLLDQVDPDPEGFEIRVEADKPIRSVGQGAGGHFQWRANELIFIPVSRSMIAVSTTTESNPSSIP